VANIKKYLGL